MASVTEIVKQMAEANNIAPPSDYPAFLAQQFNRIEGIEGDETLDLIIALVRGGVLSSTEGTALVIKHGEEIEGLAESVEDNVQRAVGPVR